MSEIANRKYLVVLATLALVVAGCGKKDAATPFTDTEGLLRYVPADTPYFLGTLKPMPDDFMDKMEPSIDEMLESYREVLEALGDADIDVEDESGEESAEQSARANAVLSELSGLCRSKACAVPALPVRRRQRSTATGSCPCSG